MYGSGALSMAHTEEDMNLIIKATEEVAKEMFGGGKWAGCEIFIFILWDGLFAVEKPKKEESNGKWKMDNG